MAAPSPFPHAEGFNTDAGLASARGRVLWALMLSALVGLCYASTLHAVFYPAFTMPATTLDRLIPFTPAFLPLYLSFFALLLVPLAVTDDPKQLRDASFGFGLIVALSGVVFLFWPTAVAPASSAALAGSWLGRALLAMDLPRNACPSLHASLAVYCTLCAQRALRTPSARLGLWTWTLLVIASALLLKRHVALDLVAGAALGSAVYAILFRPVTQEPPDTEPTLETRRIRERLLTETPAPLAALFQHDARKRARELLCFPLLAAAGVLLSLWARAHAHPFALVCGIVITAVALNTFPLLLHEGMHGVLLPGRRANHALSMLLGSTFLMSFSAYRVLHNRHHRYLGDPRDPDDYHNYARSRFVVWLLHFVRLTIGPTLYLVMIPVLALRHGSIAERKRICAEYTLLLALYSLLLRTVPVHLLLVAWGAPLLLAGCFTAIRGFTQHGITDTADPYLASRTMLPNPAIAFFLLNENYHLEHHLFPEIPSYQLPGLHRILWPKLPRVVTGRSYLAFLFAFLRATPRMDESPIGLDERNSPPAKHG